MAEQKRLNKNMVAFLTVMAMVVVVSVVALVIWQQTRRDPRVLADSAQKSEQAGDLEEAARRWTRAYAASEARGELAPEYAIAAGRCLFAMGEISGWRGLLEKAIAKVPDNRALRVALLDGLWRVQEIIGSAWLPELWRDTGQKLHELDPNDAFALASYARGLWALRGENDLATADEAAEQAFALAPRDPRVVLTYAALVDRRGRELAQKAQAEGRRTSEVAELNRKATTDTLKLLGDAFQEHPESPQLVLMYVDILRNEARRLDREKDTAGATELFAKVGPAIKAALAQNPTDPGTLYLALAQDQLEEFMRANPSPTAADIASSRAVIEEIDKNARLALERDPALYDAYALRAELKRFELGPDGEQLPLVQILDKTLDVFDAAQAATLNLRSIRAILRDTGFVPDRLQMLRRAQDIALGAWAQDPRGPDSARRLGRAEGYLNDARIKYPEFPVTYFMQAQVLVAKSDLVGGIAKFESAYAKAEQLGLGQARFWFLYARVSHLPSEQLALLYRQGGQYGEAQKYAERAVREYETVSAAPPVLLLTTAAELLGEVGRAEEGLDLLNRYREQYPQDQTIPAQRAALLTKLGRTKESKEVAQQITGTDVATDARRAQLAVDQEDYATAETILRAVLSNEATKPGQFEDALSQLVALLERTKRHAVARELVQGLLQSQQHEGLKRLLRAYEVELSVDDPEALSPEERQALDKKREALIAENPDPQGRAREYYLYYARRGDWEHAAKYLEELRAAQPDDSRLLEEEFRMRLRMKQFTQAGELASKLAQYEKGLGLDRAGGATYRGDLALATGDGELAVREFRQAVQMLPKSDDLLIRLARGHLVLGRMTEAIEVLKEARELNPRSFEVHRLLREVYRERMADTFGAEREENKTLADQSEAAAKALNPNHPVVLRWQREVAEEKDPLAVITALEKESSGAPLDAETLKRIGGLYVAAWDQIAKSEDEQARKNLAEQGARFFETTLPSAPDAALVSLARSAKDFFVLTKRAEQGEALLRGLVERRTNEDKVSLQLLVAAFFEGLGNPDAAEREYQQAQRVITEATQDPAIRRRLELQVGWALIGFQQRQGRWDRVAATCRWLLDRLGVEMGQEPGVQQVRIVLVQALFNTGELKDAESEIDDYLGRKYADRVKELQRTNKAFRPIDLPGGEFANEDVVWLTYRTQLRLARNERDKAFEDLNSLIEKTPENVWALYARGRLSLQRLRNEKAKEDLTAALRLIAREPRLELEVHGRLATLYERTKERDLVVNELRAMLDVMTKQKASGDDKQRIVAQLARVLYRDMNQFDQAQKLISEYMERFPGEAVWPLELGRLFESRADTQKRAEDKRRDYGQAATYYQRAADAVGDKNLGDKITAVIARIGALTRAERPSEAIALFQSLSFDQLPPQFQVEARARATIEVAKAYAAQKQDEAARTHWRQALEAAAGERLTLMGELASDLRSSRPADAEALLRTVVESLPAETAAGQRARAVLAMHLISAGNAAAALPVLGEVLSKSAAETPEHLGALLAQAQALEVTQDPEGAVKSYREVLTTRPNEVTALNNLSYMLVTAEKVLAPKEALTYAERLKNLLPNSEAAGTLLDTIGWVYFRNNELELAAATLLEAEDVSGPTATTCLHLAEVYQKMNRAADARAALERALERARRDGDANSIRQLEDALQKLK